MVHATDLKNAPVPWKWELRQAPKALALLQDNYPEFVATENNHKNRRYRLHVLQLAGDLNDPPLVWKLEALMDGRYNSAKGLNKRPAQNYTKAQVHV
ncbi:hypothetical protein Taro_019139 [Colocasia esculenta]|uniref:Uncharacterized protein n=1 Tax=Colocasia esculenta TaxID=4460 RepID=A0A843USM0_COLES|nr:hypothetical protein [Colocasia esculenta]